RQENASKYRAGARLQSIKAKSLAELRPLRLPSGYRLRAVFFAGERLAFAGERFAALRLRVAAAFLAERDRSVAGRAAEALPPRGPPMRPPRFDETFVVLRPRPDPLFSPPPLSRLTVAHARRSASFFFMPRFS